jgi:hypothetical protein
MSDTQRTQEWSHLYSSLLDLLSARGRFDPYGDGDFLVVDDDWGSYQQKVECTSPALFTPSVFAETQTLLSGYSSSWEIIFVLTSTAGGPQVRLVSRNRVIACDVDDASDA